MNSKYIGVLLHKMYKTYLMVLLTYKYYQIDFSFIITKMMVKYQNSKSHYFLSGKVITITTSVASIKDHALEIAWV